MSFAGPLNRRSGVRGSCREVEGIHSLRRRCVICNLQFGPANSVR